MNLVIDIGNSSSKVAVFSEQEIVFHYTFESIHLHDLLIKVQHFNIENTIVCSVNSENDEVKKIITYFNALVLTNLTPIPIFNQYQTPETLGKDRLAAIVGANALFPNKNILAVDAGTCITFDYFINNTYTGGRISPGIQMRLNALHHYTAHLPKVSFVERIVAIGENTTNAILSGVICGVLGEIETSITDFVQENKNTVVVLCGGNCNFLANHIKNSIFADPFLVLKGLNTILEFNAK